MISQYILLNHQIIRFRVENSSQVMHHNIRISDSAVRAAARYAHRYLTERNMPDKAIDLLDEATSRLRMQQESKPEDLSTVEREIMTLKILMI